MTCSDIDEAFRRLFGGPDWDAFERATFDYFDAHPSDHDAHSKYFERFYSQWQQLCSVRLYEDASSLWSKAIEIADKWEREKGGSIHKGTPYYFWGGTAILKGDIDLGFLLIHEALSEDMNAEPSGGKPYDTLPAWYFVILKDEAQEQYWGQMVRDVAAFLNDRISEYRTTCAGSLDLSQFKAQFMQDRQYREATFFFVYSLWNFRHHLLTASILAKSSFSSLLLLDLALNIYVVLEDVLKSYYKDEIEISKKLSLLIEYFSVEHSLDIHKCPPSDNKKRIELVNQQFKINGDRNGVISGALSNNLPGFNSLQIALSIAPSLRNTAAHDLTDCFALKGQAAKLLQLSLNALFTVIELGPKRKA